MWPSKITCRCGREITTDAWVCAKEREREKERDREGNSVYVCVCGEIRQHKARSKWATSRGNIQIGINIFRLCCSLLHVPCGMWRVARCLWCELLQSKIGYTTRPTHDRPQKIKDSAAGYGRCNSNNSNSWCCNNNKYSNSCCCASKLLMQTFFFAFPYLFFVFISASFRTFNIPFSCFVFAFVVGIVVAVLVAVAVASSALKLLSLFHFDFSFSCPLSSVPLLPVCLW